MARNIDERDTELDALLERFQALGWRSESKDRPRRDMAALARDVRAWQARTGGTEIQVTTESVLLGSAARDSSEGGGEEDCPECSGFTLTGDKICFLTEEDDCFDVGDEWIGRVCVYECISIGPGFGERDDGSNQPKNPEIGGGEGI